MDVNRKIEVPEMVSRLLINLLEPSESVQLIFLVKYMEKHDSYFIVTNKRFVFIDKTKFSVLNNLLISELQSIFEKNKSKSEKKSDSVLLAMNFLSAKAPINIYIFKSDHSTLVDFLRKIGVSKDIPTSIADLGRLVAEGTVGAYLIRIFQNSYVEVNGKYEKLLAISSSINVSKKTGIGRGLGQGALALSSGFLLSGGTSNRRGDVYLTIVTNVNTYSIKEDLNSLSSVMKGFASEQEVLRLEAAGNSVIEINSRQSMQQGASSTQALPNVAESLERIANLYERGLMSEEEFVAAKQQILGG